MKKEFLITLISDKNITNSDIHLDENKVLSYSMGEGNAYLCILSDDEINYGDWFVDLIDNTIHCKHLNHNESKSTWKKILVSTNPKIETEYSSTDTIPELFIKEYVKAYDPGEIFSKIDIEIIDKDSEKIKIYPNKSMNITFQLNTKNLK